MPPSASADDRPDRDLRIQVEHEPAPRAHEPFGLARLQRARLEGAAADGTEAVGVIVFTHYGYNR